MGVSFKVSKKGTRFRPKPLQFEKISEGFSDDSKENSNSPVLPQMGSMPIADKVPEDDAIETGEDAAGISGSSSCSGGHISSAETEVSFTLNLYQDGYYIGKPSEASIQDAPKSLHPYDRTSETLFSAIESGRLPGDILDDIPSKYFDGMLVCEIRDYRKSASQRGSGVSSVDQSPVVNRVSLRMSLENVVKDIPLISDDSWTYSDLMEVESRILKALQPQLCLDPTPMLDRLCSNPVTTKLNLGLCGLRKRRLSKMSEVTIKSNNQTHGKKVCIEKAQESSICRSGDSGYLSGDTTPLLVHEIADTQHVLRNSIPLRSRSLIPEVSTPPLSLLSKHQQGVGYPRVMQDHYSGTAMNASGISPSGRDFMVSYTDSGNVSSLHGKGENQNAPLTPSSKRARQTPVGLDGIQRQHLGPQLDSLPDISWNNQGLHPHLDPRVIQYASIGSQKYPQKVLEGVPNKDGSVSSFSLEHQGSRYGIKAEQTETEKSDMTEIDRSRNDSHTVEAENSQMDPQQSRLQQRIPQNPLMRSHYPQMQWHNLGQIIDNDLKKEDQLPKRKLAQSPRVSAGPVVQSPVSSRSGEFSSGSFGQQYNAVATTSTLGPAQKEKPAAISGATVGGPPSVTSSPSDSMQRQHQRPMPMKRRSDSLPRTPTMSGVGSPASVSTMINPTNANSPSISTPHVADQNILERFSKIDMLTQRRQLNRKKKKGDDYPARKPLSYSTQLISSHLSDGQNSEDLNDSTCMTPLSKSLIGGNMNVCRIRALTFVQTERRLQGNVVSSVTKARNRLMMSEKLNDGTVAMQYGDVDDSDFLLVEDYLPTLPNTVSSIPPLGLVLRCPLDMAPILLVILFQMRQLNRKKKKGDDYPARKPLSYSTQLISSHLSDGQNSEDLNDSTCMTPLSKSLIGGNMNVCRIRALTFVQTERRLQGNVVSSVTKARNRLMMSEKLNDGTVAMQYGDVDDSDFLLVEDYLPTLPNTHYADLLAKQFYSLMVRDGYQLTDNQVRPKQHLGVSFNGQSNGPAVPSDGMAAEMQLYSETNIGQASNAVGTPLSSGNASLNTSQSPQNSSWVLPPGSSQSLQISQGFVPGATRPGTPQQLDSQQSIQQQQIQQPLIQQHAQRASLMTSASPLSHLNVIGPNSNVQLGNHMISKPSHSQLQFFQQQQQQQQPHSQMHRKMMMGLGASMNMGNMGTNVGGLQGLGNVLGMGGVRMGGPGIPAMGTISGIGNMSQNPMNPTNISNAINQQLRAGNLSPAQAAAIKIRMVQNRAGMLGGPQSGIAGLSGQMHPGSASLSMLGENLNRSNINPLQRTNMESMGPPKMIPGTNFYMNQPQQQLQLQHQQQQMQQQQQHIQQQQQQISSPLQTAVSPPQVGSPSAMSIQQQMTQQFSPQQFNQQSPISPRLSSGTLPTLNAANVGTAPPSPQLSSQTHGSVGSITSNSMELQGVNKSNSAGNMQG
ncbi:Phytochrome-dependent late-flowering [Thalictrum thalictroides]|uniref:Phytochrome-dependent late-flowering n=1 Tax=Thalictrum thalictroides TaxID=46969 RepID=A0A7J6V9D1_THATH|nr:Phytochrome-dependent late-flowering [Thalictrum thalictroides]